MKIKKWLLLLAVFMTTVIAVAGCSRAVVREEIRESYQIRPGTIIEIYNPNGNVTVSGWDQSRVEVFVIKESYFGYSALEEVDIIIDITDKMVIATEHPSIQSRVNVSYEIMVPRGVMLGLVQCSNGNIDVNDVLGDPELSTSNGSITAKDIEGLVTARSSNGDIIVLGARGLGGLRTSNGNIESELFVLPDNLDIRTNNGTITLSVLPELAMEIKASTSNGMISIQNLNISTTEMEKTFLSGTMGGGGNLVNITTSNGSIYLKRLR